MNWDALGALAEIIGAVGVIASLLFLALQIRQNSKVVAANTFQSISSTSADVSIRIAENEDLARLLRLALTDSDSLDNDEQMRVEMLWRGAFRNYEHYYYQYVAGTLDPDVWSGYLETMLSMLDSAYGQAWWEKHQAAFGRKFGSFLTGAIAERPISRQSAFLATESRSNAPSNTYEAP
jgi:hypothetical protein